MAHTNNEVSLHQTNHALAVIRNTYTIPTYISVNGNKFRGKTNHGEKIEK